jgi:hypothetical protein
MSVSVLVSRWPPSDDWRADALFSHDIAGTSDFCDYWHEPAVRLGLPLLASIYNHGRSFAAEEHERLSDELDQLERHWGGHDFAGAVRVAVPRDGEEAIPLHECLLGGLAVVRRAIALAHESGAVVSIG